MKIILMILPVFTLMACATTNNLESIHLDYDIVISEIDKNVYIATDKEFYNSNILIVKMDNGTVVITSSPFENLATTSLMNWVKRNLKPKKIIAINPHFHRDGTGGNRVYEDFGAETWASDLTKDFALKHNKRDPIKAAKFYTDPKRNKRILDSPISPPKNTFPIKEGKKFKFGNEIVEVFYPGPAHTKDNSVVYFHEQKILFGGCMIKPFELGYMGDAQVSEWPASAKSLKKFEIKTVIPGHGKWGGPELIDKTIQVAESYLKLNTEKK